MLLRFLCVDFHVKSFENIVVEKAQALNDA